MVPRLQYLEEIRRKLAKRRIVALLGPRQAGKTTLAREIAANLESHYFDLEDPVDLARLEEPKQALEALEGLVVIDEIQRKPDLYPLLRVLADRIPLPARFLILGSASPDLIENASESVAGRISFVNVGGFSLRETGLESLKRLWVQGGMPESYLDEEPDSFEWRTDFITTFLERDFSRNILNVEPQLLRRFWSMVAHTHGQYWNASKISRSLDIAHTTAKRYLDAFAGTYMVRLLPPWHSNLGKRIVKSPKAYIRDSGILHALLGLRSFAELQRHPALGHSWEGFALEQLLRTLNDDRNAYFWATQSGAELDLLYISGQNRIGFEFKYSDAPRTSRSMHIAIDDLQLQQLYVVYPGEKRYRISDRIEAIPLSATLNAKDFISPT